MEYVALKACAAELDRRGSDIEAAARNDVDAAGALAMQSLAVVFRLAAGRRQRDVWRVTKLCEAEPAPQSRCREDHAREPA